MPTTKEMIRSYMDEVERLEEESRTKKRFRAVEGFPFWPHEFLRDMALILIFTAAMIYLSAFIPYYLEGPADPAGQPEVILPDWYLLWSYGLLKIAVSVRIFGVEVMTGDLLGVLLNGIVVGFMIIVPFISRGAARRPTQAAAMAGFGVFGMLLGITLSVYSVDVLLMGAYPVLATDLWVDAGLAEMLHLLQTNVLSILTLGVPVLGAFVTYFFMKWRGALKQGTPGYEHKLSASYYKIR